MPERRVSILIDIDLEKYSKEAHAVTVNKIARIVEQFAIGQMEAHGYSVRRAVSTTTLGYIRHVTKHIGKSPGGKLKVVKGGKKVG